MISYGVTKKKSREDKKYDPAHRGEIEIEKGGKGKREKNADMVS